MLHRNPMWTVLLTVSLSAMCAMGQASGQPPDRVHVVETRAEYARRLEDAMRSMQRAERLARRDPDAAKQEALSALRRLRGGLRVRDGDRTVEPDLSELINELSAASVSPPSGMAESIRKVKARLSPILWAAQFSVAREKAGAAAEASDREADRVLKAVLSRGEFQSAQRAQTLYERVLRWSLNLLGRLFSGLSPGRLRSIANLILWGVLWGGGTALLILLAYVIYSLAPLFFPGLRARRGEQDQGVELRSARPQSIEQLLKMAQQVMARGEFREALRWVFRAVLLTLDRHRLIEFDESRTNGEYLNALRPGSDVRRALEPVARSFDEKWYGAAETRLHDVEFFMSQLEQIERLVTAEPRAA